MHRLLFALVLLLPVQAAASPVTVDIRWEYRNFPARVELFELDGHRQLWETKSVKSVAEAPLGVPIAGSALSMQPGQRKRFVLAIRNESAEPLYFFASPHVVSPVEHSLGFKFRCLCINHAFSIGAGEVWYRVVEFNLSRGYVGERLTITHTIIGIDRERAEAFALDRKQGDF